MSARSAPARNRADPSLTVAGAETRSAVPVTPSPSARRARVVRRSPSSQGAREAMMSGAEQIATSAVVVIPLSVTAVKYAAW